MADNPPDANIPAQKQSDQSLVSDLSAAAEIAQLRRELETVKNANPFRMAEMAIELQIEQLRVVEITAARDSALQRLSECCEVIRQKNEFIKQLQEDSCQNSAMPDATRQLRQFGNEAADVEQLNAHTCNLEMNNEELRLSVEQLRATAALDLPPCYEANEGKASIVDAAVQTDAEVMQTNVISANYDQRKYISPKTVDPRRLLEARNAFLASIPLPDDAPDATLTAFVIPSPFTIQDFIGSVPASLRAVLGDYKILHSATTSWCPEREENGFMYCPVFKCSTNPRIATAHRWMAVDIFDCMDKPTECFYNKDGVWYYAGTYETLQMDELSVKEWAQLPANTVSAIVKETLSGRKQTCPQNTYETTQLYAVGALKVACVALICVAFNQEVYKSILEHSVKFSESKWKALANVSVKALSGALPTSPNMSAKENGNKSAPATPTMKTPIMQKHFPRTSSLLSNPSSINGSPPPRGGNSEIQNYMCSSPPVGLGFGSSTWSMTNSRADSAVSLLVNDFESMQLSTEYLKSIQAECHRTEL